MKTALNRRGSANADFPDPDPDSAVLASFVFVSGPKTQTKRCETPTAEEDEC
jgi:hypothetical protein